MKTPQSRSVRRLLTSVIVAGCSLVVLLTCGILAAYQWFEFRSSLVHDMTALCAVMADETRAALAFQDDAAAKEVLRSLESVPAIDGAALFTPDGARFAEYSRTAGFHLHASPKVEGYRFGKFHLGVFHPVVLNGRQIGSVRLAADLKPMYERLWWFGLFALLVLFITVPVAILLSAWLQRPITRPILALAETARGVAERGDYGVRAAAEGWREIGLLSEAFNRMLGGIAERETALQSERDRVQSQVARLELLHRITRAIGERQDLQSIFQVVVRTVEEDLPVDFACLCLHDETSRILQVGSVGVRSEALGLELATGPASRIEAESNGLARCLAGKLIYEADLRRVAGPLAARLSAAGLVSLVAAPLLVESKVFGALVVGRRSADGFISMECEFLGRLGEHVALAAHQAQLYQALQQAYDDLRQTQQAVMQQERLRALGEMASGIAHDINNAISPVALYTEYLIEREPGLSTRAREYLETIRRAVEDVAETVARMREFYRQGEASLAMVPVNLSELAGHALDLSRARWSDMPQQRGVVIAMKQELEADLPPIKGVESEIREALVNLVFNAVDAMPEGGTLTVRTRRAGPAVQIEVGDTGVGMSEETKRRCLEPFFTTKGERGTGLGLAMVYGIVRRHAGEIEIDSTLGKGTVMRLSFPAVAEAEAAPTEAPAEARPSRMRLLVVDDDPLLIKSLRDILETDGHVVTATNGGLAGIEAFRKATQAGEPFAAVITDLGMPYVDGRKVAAAVKGLSPTTPVLLLTGWGRRMSAEGDKPPHVDMILNKPPKLRELREALAQCAAGLGKKAGHG